MLGPVTKSTLAAALLVLLAAAPAADAQISAERIASGLPEPVYLAQPVGDPRLFVVLRGGTIRILENGVVLPDPFLDISASVRESGEGGLLSLVFAPDYATSGVFYVYYTGFSETSPVDMRSVVSRFTVSGDPLTATDVDEQTEAPLLELDQPDQVHNGGTIALRDGFLWLALADGGDGGDSSQSDASLLGKLIRLDLATPSPAAGDWEIVAKGFRNPFRWSFDRETGDLWIADVGQVTQEEIDVVPAAAIPVGGEPVPNFGWNIMEGNRCYNDVPPGCFDAGFTAPVYTYNHPGLETGAVIGGVVYRGDALPSMRGFYLFSDATRASFLYRLRWTEAGGVEDIEDIGDLPVDAGELNQLVAICEDAAGELYTVGRLGEIHRLVPEPQAAAGAAAAIGALASRCLRRAV